MTGRQFVALQNAKRSAERRKALRKLDEGLFFFAVLTGLAIVLYVVVQV